MLFECSTFKTLCQRLRAVYIQEHPNNNSTIWTEEHNIIMPISCVSHCLSALQLENPAGSISFAAEVEPNKVTLMEHKVSLNQ